MDQNVAKTPPLTDSPAASKNEALKQLAESAGGDGSIFSQLAANPFFTAVCLMVIHPCEQ